MTVVYLLDENDFEIDRLTFYNQDSELKIAPELRLTLDNLPHFLKKIYNSGLNNEAVEFSVEDINV